MVTNSQQQQQQQQDERGRAEEIQAALDGVPAKDKHMAVLFKLLFDELDDKLGKLGMGLGTRIDNMGTALDKMGMGLARLVDATPAAASIPKVFVLAAGGSRTGRAASATTWTFVKAATSVVTPASTATTTTPTNNNTTTTSSATTTTTTTTMQDDNRGGGWSDNSDDDDNNDDEFTYLLVSCASHGIHRIRNATDENGVDDVSLISIGDDAASFLASIMNAEDGAVGVTSVGFHTKIMSENENKKKLTPDNDDDEDGSCMDIVFLQLSGKPPASIVSEEFAIPEIIPVDTDSVLQHGKPRNLAGTGRSGRVNGTGLLYHDDTKCFSFRVDFAEKAAWGGCHVYYEQW
jgi:hypothetical protein